MSAKPIDGTQGLSLGRVAKYCGVTRKTILRWIQGGLLKSFNLPSGHNRILPDEVVRFLQQHGMPLPADLISQKPLSVLICDDDPQIRRLMANLLKSHFQVEEAANGVEACIRLGANPPQLLLIDIRMPKMDGISVCRQVRKDTNLSTLKIIVVSSYIDQEARVALHDLANAIIQKPFSPKELIDVCLATVGQKSVPRLVGDSIK